MSILRLRTAIKGCIGMALKQLSTVGPAHNDEKPPRILIVDDASVSLAILNKVLSAHYTILQASDGLKALELLRQGDIDLVLTDVIMPGMSGLELLQIMRQDADLSMIPVMMITADGNSENETAALELGAMDVIRKPFVPQILLARVRNLLALQASYKTAEENRLNEQRLAVQAEVLRAAERDELTGVLTRQAFYRHVRTYLDEHPNEKLEMLRFDLDNFSTVNDLMGVKAGDRLLSELGHKIQDYCSQAPDIAVVGHIEADHFAALHNCSGPCAQERFFLLQRWVAENAAEYHLNCRLGAYSITDPSVEPSVMCDRALMALRSTKDSFTTRFARYDESMRKKLLEEQELTAQMIPALESGQFVVYYQPQINYSNGELVGAEALVRWEHPDKGLLPPSVFLPLFEKNGLITQLDAFVWDRVCRQLRTWIKEYGDHIAPVSVNVSRIDIYGADLCSRLTELVKKYDIPIRLLRLEITESAYVGDAARLCEIVEELSRAGFLIEMDDFGSAYSSLNMLKDIPVDILKLDMKFLSDTKSSARSGNILSSVVRMARWLRMPVIAEGVETRPQADYLCSIGCLYMQGYYFSRPIPTEQYEEYLKSHELGQTDKYKNIDISAAENFWDASAQTALIFNSYVGGAVILQRTGGALEMLRANDEFFRVIHIDREAYLPSMLDVWQRFFPEDQAVFSKMLDRVSNGDAGAECDVGSPAMTGDAVYWTRNRAKLLARNGESEIFYVSVEDITA